MPKTKVVYEWDVEVSDEHGDIIDHNHFDTYAEALATAKELAVANKVELVLVRDVVEDDGNLVDRSWAYTDENYKLGLNHAFRVNGEVVCLVPTKLVKQTRSIHRAV